MKKLIRGIILWAMADEIAEAKQTLRFVDDEVRCAARESECANRDAYEAITLARKLRDDNTSRS